jgi:hypothetical protein
MNDLTGRLPHEYRRWRRVAGDLAPLSELPRMVTVRGFTRGLESIDGTKRDLHTTLTQQCAHIEWPDLLSGAAR